MIAWQEMGGTIRTKIFGPWVDNKCNAKNLSRRYGSAREL